MKRSHLLLSVLACLSLTLAHAADPKPVSVVCKTTKGDLEIAVQPAWSPLGAARFLQLVDDGFFTNVPLFRCVNNFICQFGAMPPHASAKTYANIPDDPKQPALRAFKRGYLSFAGAGPNTRSTQMFITLGDNIGGLGEQAWETPFAQITPASLQSTVAHLNTSYGDMPPWGKGPDPQKIAAMDGATYLTQNYPQLDYIKSCARR
ncbi:cyclophilin family peptidyl-prolyl cis-trans isomerase [Silvimonas terrae]|uniref:Cyclophilin family peptidyl-prolyl cis-trans isomerase n=1 Tax=Silvimonas terrae TaxID=300266 RepID=A0A840RKT6_9NEIS|nr:peptidylprolyl isomerase [Silvimonas terrae]MBB5192832.1 cyclophilin family peptidyl-prolyl cis-trans isomerase [Silvimonas terrae]